MNRRNFLTAAGAAIAGLIMPSIGTSEKPFQIEAINAKTGKTHVFTTRQGVISIPSGTWKVKSSIVLPSNVSLQSV